MTDEEIALSQVQSEILGALLSIQSFRDIELPYFDRLREAVDRASEFFRDEPQVPSALVTELVSGANVLRNEATAFSGRDPACSQMADWLEMRAAQLGGR